jgi:hypothetical protein
MTDSEKFDLTYRPPPAARTNGERPRRRHTYQRRIAGDKVMILPT